MYHFYYYFCGISCRLWALSIGSGNGESGWEHNSTGATFSVQITLTDQGLSMVNEVQYTIPLPSTSPSHQPPYHPSPPYITQPYSTLQPMLHHGILLITTPSPKTHTIQNYPTLHHISSLGQISPHTTKGYTTTHPPSPRSSTNFRTTLSLIPANLVILRLAFLQLIHYSPCFNITR